MSMSSPWIAEEDGSEHQPGSRRMSLPDLMWGCALRRHPCRVCVLNVMLLEHVTRRRRTILAAASAWFTLLQATARIAP